MTIKYGKFDYVKNKKFFSSKTQYGYKYKGQFSWGTNSFFPPKTHYKSITGCIRDQKFEIPIKDIENLFDLGGDDGAYCYYDSNNNKLYLILRNGDGSETYDVLFLIENGAYKKRIIQMPD